MFREIQIKMQNMMKYYFTLVIIALVKKTKDYKYLARIWGNERLRE